MNSGVLGRFRDSRLRRQGRLGTTKVMVLVSYQFIPLNYLFLK